jgi:hypothetical protein
VEHGGLVGEVYILLHRGEEGWDGELGDKALGGLGDGRERGGASQSMEGREWVSWGRTARGDSSDGDVDSKPKRAARNRKTI